jgi:hypothetical protein
LRVPHDPGRALRPLIAEVVDRCLNFVDFGLLGPIRDRLLLVKL